MWVNVFNPYWWVAQPRWAGRRQAVPRVGGIFKLITNAVTLDSDAGTVNYGVCPEVVACLPVECVALITFHAEAPDGGDELPVTVVLPGNTVSTVSTVNARGTACLSVIDSDGDTVTGGSVSEGMQRLAYIDRLKGTAKLIGFTNS